MFEDEHNFSILEDLHNEARAQSLLQIFRFADWKSAWKILLRMESRDQQGLTAIFSFLMAALKSAADPDRSLVNFERFMEGFGPELFTELEENPRVIEILITLFSASPFLTEILLRTPDALELLKNRQVLTERKTIEQFQHEAISTARSFETEAEKLDALRRYQRRQLLRIGTNDFLGLYDLRAVFSELSRMATGLVRACLALAAQKRGFTLDGFIVLAVGKLGGWELNYSSDIDLLFIAKKNPDDYINLAETLIKYIASTTPEGFLYRVDFRLRPWGNDGPLITTLDVYLQYIQKHARLWEKQAFLKARPIAGNLSFGEELLKEIEPFLFQSPADEVRVSIFSMKQRTEEFLREKGRSWGEVKLGEGSIRDIEFVVQLMQMTHPSVRTRATLKAIPRLREMGLLEAKEAHILTEGYNFLRTIEHYLQIIDYRQTYSLPTEPKALALLARKLDFNGLTAGEQFVERYEQHCHAIRSIFLKYVGNESIKQISKLPQTTPQVLQHITRMDASYFVTFSPEEIQQHAQLINKIGVEANVIVDVKALNDSRWRVTVVGDDYLGELSFICGLLFVYGLNIIESQAFTYEPLEKGATGAFQRAGRKIVDVFIVQPVHSDLPIAEMWTRYTEDLNALIFKTQTGQRREARGELAKRVGEVFQGMAGNPTTLYPIDIEIDNNSSNLYTILEIGTTDTVGFLYEFSTALAINHINIARMFVQSIGSRVKDTIYITDDGGQKITSFEKQRELRAATVLIKHFTHLLPRSPNPESALLHFQEFLSQLFDRPNWPDELIKLEQPEVLDALARLLGVSDFLWDDFLRMQYSNLFPVVSDVNALAASKDRLQLKDELDEKLKQAGDWRVALNAFKDREMFRIDMRHILGYTPEFWDFSYALTDLVEVVVAAAFCRCTEEMCKEYGEPYLENGSLCPASFFALGKCGGRELGFASDIELMLIYGGKGWTRGLKNIATSDFYEKLIRSFIKSIQARQEGIFQIDLQLRPYGKAGSLAVSFDAFQHYFAPQGPAWAYERQALVKLRPIAGDKLLGEKVCEMRDELLYTGEPFNTTAMRAMRERQIRHLVTAGTFNAKYSPGGLVDLEYLVQGLQISYGAENPSLRLTNIRMAMAALAEAGILSPDDYNRLRKAHTFLRWLIDSLRVVHGNTKDINIPLYDSEEFSFLARRLRYGSDTNRLQEDLTRYPADIQELSTRLLPTL
jgi:[glutamine synthetase] adenylyltransferase / [glutamine synthetase]-adenylyl-L-tyrosine phosphorylase